MNEKTGESVVVRRAKEEDLVAIARINAAVFLGDRNHAESARRWIDCWFRAFPLYQYFVVEAGNEAGSVVAGYIGWQVHGGFQRPEPVLELEQLGIDPEFQGKGLGPKITNDSVKEVIRWLRETNTRIESHVSLVVWGYTNNLNALKVYLETFTDGPIGSRIQYGSRHETMCRWRIPIIRPVRDR